MDEESKQEEKRLKIEEHGETASSADLSPSPLTYRRSISGHPKPKAIYGHDHAPTAASEVKAKQQHDAETPDEPASNAGLHLG